MKNRKKKYTGRRLGLLLIVAIVVISIVVFFQNNKHLVVVSVVEEIDDYNYHLNSNSTRIYKKYYKELEEELKNNKIDEENYAKLISKLFIIDYYTLDNKVTNKDIGGVDFIHSSLKDKFIDDSINTVYKYVKSNLYNDRKQKLPEVTDVSIKSIENIKYNNKDLKDDRAFKVICEVSYVKDYDYPKEIILGIMHEDNKLVIMEIW